jgi:hypothetical protein
MKLLICSLALISLSLLLVGCKKDAKSVGSGNNKLFASAPAPLKADWEQANAAMATNGYFTAFAALKNLQQQSLSPEQLKAVNDTVTAVNDQMYEAANKGDAAAKQAIQDLRKSMGR